MNDRGTWKLHSKHDAHCPTYEGLPPVDAVSTTMLVFGSLGYDRQLQ